MDSLHLAMLAAGYIFGGFLVTGVIAHKWGHAFEIAAAEAVLAIFLIWCAS